MKTTKTMSAHTIFLLVASLSVASAFNNKLLLSSLAGESLRYVETTNRPSSRSHGTRIYRSGVHALPLPSSLSRARRQQQTSTLTRLQFSDDSSSDTAIESKWWRKLFTASSQSPSGMTRNTSIPDSSSESEEQDNVDAYLEFLDRRYRRLHSDDKKEETQVKQQGSSLLQ